jgi:hypothetical protein
MSSRLIAKPRPKRALCFSQVLLDAMGRHVLVEAEQSEQVKRLEDGVAKGRV